MVSKKQLLEYDTFAGPSVAEVMDLQVHLRLAVPLNIR